MKYALMILQLVPVIIDIIKKLEEVMPESGQGAKKLEMLREILAEVYPNIMEMWDSIEKIVGVIVGLFNRNKVFEPKPPVIEE